MLHQGEMIQKHLSEMNEKQQQQSSNYYEKYSESDFEIAHCEELSSLPSCSRWNNDHTMLTDTDDELFLVIENHNDNDSGVFISKEQRFFHEMEVEDLDYKNFAETPKRKFRRNVGTLRDHALNNIHSSENFARTSSKFELIHKELRSEMNNVKEIIDQEQSFLTKINRRSSFDDTYNNISEFCDNNETVIL